MPNQMTAAEIEDRLWLDSLVVGRDIIVPGESEPGTILHAARTGRSGRVGLTYSVPDDTPQHYSTLTELEVMRGLEGHR
jgi:hypothetical protein